MWTKRQFLKLSGLAIAPNVMPQWLQGAQAATAKRERKVIIVTFGGGVRNSETFAPDGLVNIPRLAAMKAEGYFYTQCVNQGVLSHFNSTASLSTGNWQRVDDFGFQRPVGATLFEQYRKATGAGALDAWVIATNKSFLNMGAGTGSALGPKYGANVVLPKQLLLDAVKDVTGQDDAGFGVADREVMRKHLEAIIDEGYEGVGSTIFTSGPQLDKNVRKALVAGLREYIQGPESPTSGDELTYFITREVMREFAPKVMLVNFWDMDVAHWGSYSLYLQAITRTDRLVGMLWDEVQANERYKDLTTVMVLPELGRDGDFNTANGFLNHRSGDASCRNVWMLAMGAGVSKGETDRPIRHVDVPSTALSMLGVKPTEMMGSTLSEILI